MLHIGQQKTCKQICKFASDLWSHITAALKHDITMVMHGSVIQWDSDQEQASV